MDQRAMRMNANLADQGSFGMLQLPPHHSDDPSHHHHLTNILGQNIPGKNISGQNIQDKIYQTKVPGQNISDNMYQKKYNDQNIPCKIYQTKYTGQNIPYQLQTNQMLDVSVRFRIRVRIRIRAECATEESSKHPMTAYVRVYFKLKYTGYILSGIFCLVYIVRYVLSQHLLSGIFCSVRFLKLFYYLFYIPPSCANTLERSAGSRVCDFGPFSGFQLCLRSSVCYRTPSLQPKYKTTGVNYTALHDHSLQQPYSAQPTLLACQCRGPRIQSQICSGDRGIEPRTLRTSRRVCNHQTTKSSYLVRICFVRYILSGYVLFGIFCLDIFCPGLFCPGIFYPSTENAHFNRVLQFNRPSFLR